MPIVYILTNQSMPDTIKIGITDNLERRIKELDNTSVPLPFECYYAVEVDDASKIEKKIHEGLDDKRIRDNREFFRMIPEHAKAALEIASGKDVTPKDDVVETEGDRAALQKERKRNRFNFAEVGVEPGEILKFKKDPSITCKVVEGDLVEFRGRKTSLTNSALEVIHELGYKWTKIAGPQFWTYKGKTLYDLNQED